MLTKEEKEKIRKVTQTPIGEEFKDERENESNNKNKGKETPLLSP